MNSWWKFSAVEGKRCDCYNQFVPHASSRMGLVVRPAADRLKRTILATRSPRVWKRGQVAQVVERSPEKAGVGGSTPSLATIIPKNLLKIGRSDTGKITHGRLPTITG